MIQNQWYVIMDADPILRDLVGWLSKPMNRKILHQDRRVVLTQEPRKTSLNMDEKLIQGDLPIVEYRKLREELLQKT